jgi:GMP synthase-like glutamine amidotransferase
MKPILILQNQSGDGPAYLGRWLAARGIAFDVRDTESGATYPADLSGHSALALLGGEMSVNDPLPSLRQAERLILEAMRDAKPVLGHCLGGQLMAHALGARVGVSPAPEIGWQPIEVDDTPAARAWLGEAGAAAVFQWHYEAFELPPGAERIASSRACPIQAFAVGPHLAMQFHVEVDADKLARWSQEADAPEFRLHERHASVQDGPGIRAGAARHLVAHQRLADRIYARWLAAAGCP